jgi:hypothetical protein
MNTDLKINFQQSFFGGEFAELALVKNMYTAYRLYREIGGACGTYGGQDGFILEFGGEI